MLIAPTIAPKPLNSKLQVSTRIGRCNTGHFPQETQPERTWHAINACALDGWFPYIPSSRPDPLTVPRGESGPAAGRSPAFVPLLLGGPAPDALRLGRKSVGQATGADGARGADCLRRFGVALKIADLDEGVRLEIKEGRRNARLSPVYGPEQAYW